MDSKLAVSKDFGNSAPSDRKAEQEFVSSEIDRIRYANLKGR